MSMCVNVCVCVCKVRVSREMHPAPLIKSTALRFNWLDRLITRTSCLLSFTAARVCVCDYLCMCVCVCEGSHMTVCVNALHECKCVFSVEGCV